MGTSIWLPTWSFTTIPAPPSAPNLVVPSNGATGVSPTPVLLGYAGGASSYQAEISHHRKLFVNRFQHERIDRYLNNRQRFVIRHNLLLAGRRRMSETKLVGRMELHDHARSAFGVPVLVPPTTAADIGTVTAPTLTWNALGVPATYRLQASLSSMFLPFLTRAA